MSRTIEDFIKDAEIARQSFQKSDQLELAIALDWILQLASDVKEQLAQPPQPIDRIKE